MYIILFFWHVGCDIRGKDLVGVSGQADIEKAIVVPAKGKILCLLKFLQYEEFPAYMSIESDSIAL